MKLASSMARKGRRPKGAAKLNRAQKSCGGKGLNRNQFNSCVRRKMRGG